MSPEPRRLAATALLFDLDGVLVDSTASVEHHWREWATRHGLDVAKILAVVHGRRAIDTIREQAPELDAEREVAALVEAEAHTTVGVVAIPGAKELVASLPPNRWTIVTSGTHRVAAARLRAAGLPMPPLMVTADRVKHGKPDPEGYLAAARTLGTHPSNCLVLEDAPAGVEAARRAGMRCIALTTTHPRDTLSAATAIVPDLRSITVSHEPVTGLVVTIQG